MAWELEERGSRLRPPQPPTCPGHSRTRSPQGPFQGLLSLKGTSTGLDHPLRHRAAEPALTEAVQAPCLMSHLSQGASSSPLPSLLPAFECPRHGFIFPVRGQPALRGTELSLACTPRPPP